MTVKVFERYAEDYLYQLEGKTSNPYALLFPIKKENVGIFNDLRMRATFYPKKQKRIEVDTLFDIFDVSPDRGIHGHISVSVSKTVETLDADSVIVQSKELGFRFQEGDYIGVVFVGPLFDPQYGVIKPEMVDAHWKRVDTKIGKERFYKNLVQKPMCFCA